MTTPIVNSPVMMPAGAQEITSDKAKSDREEQSFMDVLSIADSASRTRKSEQPERTEPRAVTGTKKTETAKPQETDKGSSDRNEDAVKDSTKTEKRSETKEAKDDSGTTEKIDKAADEIKETIEDELGITDEELAVVMETLGLTNADLFDPKVITEIVAAVKDVTPVDIVTDAALTETVSTLQQGVREITSDLVQEMDITPEEFKNTLAELKNEYEVASLKPETKENEEDFSKVLKTETEDPKSPADTVRTPAEAVRSKEAEPDRTERISEEDKGDERVSLNVKVKDQEGSQGSAPDDQSDDILRSEGRVRHTETHAAHHETDNSIFFQNLNTAVENTLEAAASTENVPYGAANIDARDLIEQIQNQIRAVIDTETQSLSMQLHPQSLGRLNVELVAKAGQLTAQFEAENASVKAALETRIVELKETLELRGIRVESVEVTIASHEFEQNLMGGEQQAPSEGEAGRRSGRTRNINLNELDETDIDGEDIPEDERIARDMMAANGNSVDFTA